VNDGSFFAYNFLWGVSFFITLKNMDLALSQTCCEVETEIHGSLKIAEIPFNLDGLAVFICPASRKWAEKVF
jgi:hypothetical protein